MNRAEERTEVQQDLHAMRHARSFSTLGGIAEAMRGLGRWSPAAEAAYASRLVELRRLEDA